MTCVNLPPLLPAEQLAVEEVLLDAAEDGLIGETLTFWEARQAFVVLGYGNKVATETNQAACERLEIPILRRISGGGTVLQGPGVLNYSLVLQAKEGTALASITTANRFVMERNAAALTKLLGQKVEVQGHTDLAIAGHKFSGNAQRRKRTHLLFHGAMLLNLDLNLLDAVLPMPSLEPDYRQHRSHLEFLTQLPCPASAIKAALCSAWSCNESAGLDSMVPDWRELAAKLLAEKYSRKDWNHRV